MAVRWWNVPRTKRFYVEHVTGYPIVPGADVRASKGAKNPGTTWSVFDANNAHAEVARWEPTGGRDSGICKLYADQLCAKLNREEEKQAA